MTQAIKRIIDSSNYSSIANALRCFNWLSLSLPVCLFAWIIAPATLDVNDTEATKKINLLTTLFPDRLRPPLHPVFVQILLRGKSSVGCAEEWDVKIAQVCCSSGSIAPAYKFIVSGHFVCLPQYTAHVSLVDNCIRDHGDFIHHGVHTSIIYLCRNTHVCVRPL